ncbi:hypothetical protein BVC80_8301g5 [Macleaya cordata]|uniref:Uncharacterized protein n=1 Tax=Macleaya cordata TaxID=56857 RepID=A0A200QRT0_MACCD|nr:hypothetical protein BVC80_8301g5 [Macleaya cordata]
MDSRDLRRGPSRAAARRARGKTGRETNIDAISTGKQHRNHTESQDGAWERTEEERAQAVHRT